MVTLILALFGNLALWAIALYAALFIAAALIKAQKRTARLAPAIAIRRFAVCAILSAALIGTANYIVNPLGIYPIHFLAPIGDRTRADKLQLLQQLPSPVDVVILGSSRSINLWAGEIQQQTGLSAFNASVDAGVPRDYRAFALYLEAQNRLPRVFIVGLGPEQMAISDNDAKFEYFDPLDAYLSATNRLPSIFDVGQTQATLRQIGTLLTGKYEPDPVARLKSLYLDDGTQPYPSSPAAMESAVKKFLADKPQFGDYVNQDPVNHLRAFVNLCRVHHIKLIVYFPPYHPQALAYYMQNTAFSSMQQKVRRTLDDLQKIYPFEFYDFTDITTISGNASDFVDDHHPSDSGQRKITTAILNRSALGN